MTQTLTISDGTTTVNLLTGDVTVRLEGWGTQLGGAEAVWETFELRSKGATDANVRTAQANLEALFRRAREYLADPLDATPVWMTWQSEGESAKRALVLDGTTEVLSLSRMSPLLGVGSAVLRAAVLRAAEWENSSASSYGPSDPVSTSGAAGLAPSLSAGTRDSRIEQMAIATSSVTALTEWWIGIRKTRKGTAGFIGLWEAEDGTNGTNSSDAVDATASDGNKVTCTFATGGLLNRLTIRWNQVTGSNYDDIIGRYLVLCRCKVDAAGTEVLVQLRHGWAGLYSGEIVGETYIAGETAWTLIELGTVQIPPTGDRSSLNSADIGEYVLELYAQRVSASGSLDIDAFILIPAEHLVHVTGAAVEAGAGQLYIYTTPDGEVYALGENAGGLLGNVELSHHDWALPADGAMIACAALDASGQHLLSKTATFTLSYYPRWAGYRTS